jgi:predicted DNA-binding transcriptional regulator AlpA
MANQSKRPFVSTKGLSAYSGFTPHYYDQLRSQGKGPPYIRIGRSIRYDLDEYDKWIEERTVRPSTPAPAPAPAPLPAWLQPATKDAKGAHCG